MDNQRAIQILKNFRGGIINHEIIKAFDMAIEALEKIHQGTLTETNTNCKPTYKTAVPPKKD